MLEERALLGRRQQPRREARLVEESPEIVAGVREVRARGSRDAAQLIPQKTAARPGRSTSERRSRRSALQRTLKRSARGRGRQAIRVRGRGRLPRQGRWRPRTARRAPAAVEDGEAEHLLLAALVPLFPDELPLPRAGSARMPLAPDEGERAGHERDSDGRYAFVEVEGATRARWSRLRRGRARRAAREGGAGLLRRCVARWRPLRMDGQRRRRRGRPRPAERACRPSPPLPGAHLPGSLERGGDDRVRHPGGAGALLALRSAARVLRRAGAQSRTRSSTRSPTTCGTTTHSRRAVRDQRPHGGADREGAGRRRPFSRLRPRRGRLRPSMTSLNFLLSRTLARTLARGTRSSSPVSTTTRTCRRGSARAWPRRRGPVRPLHRRSSARPRRPRATARREPASSRSPWRRTPSARSSTSRGLSISRTGGRAGVGRCRPLRTAARSTFAPGTSTSWILLAVQVLRAHLRLAYGRRELLGSTAPLQGPARADEPVGSRFEHGTMQHELLAGFVAAVEYVESIGWEAIVARERARRALPLRPAGRAATLYGLDTMEGRVPTFCFNLPGQTPEDVAVALAERDVAVAARRLLRDRGDAAARPRRRRCVRGDRPLQHRRGGRSPARCRRGARLRLLVLGGTRFLGRAAVEAAVERGHEVTLFNRGRLARALPRPRAAPRRPGRRPRAPRGTTRRTRSSTVRLHPARRPASSSSSPATSSTASSSRRSRLVATLERGYDESAPLARLDDPASEVMRDYGALKAACERVVDEHFPARSAIVRAVDRRAARPDRPVHVLALRIARGGWLRAGAARAAVAGSSTLATSAGGSSCLRGAEGGHVRRHRAGAANGGRGPRDVPRGRAPTRR